MIEVREREWSSEVRCTWGLGTPRWCKNKTRWFVEFAEGRAYRCPEHERQTLHLFAGGDRALSADTEAPDA